MLAELLEYLATPCPAQARRLGYLAEAVAIRARHRRCRAAWQSHLERSKGLVRAAAARTRRRRLALVLGSGALLDVPLAELSGLFDQVVLADLAHPLNARLAAWRLGNVALVHADLTGTLHNLGGPSLPEPAPPQALSGLEPDLTVSANVLSQLPLLPRKHLEKTQTIPPAELDAFCKNILTAHLDWLDTLPGVRCLISDVKSQAGEDRMDLLMGLGSALPGERWVWNMAPRPEVRPDVDVTRLVAGVVWSGPDRFFNFRPT